MYTFYGNYYVFMCIYNNELLFMCIYSNVRLFLINCDYIFLLYA